MHMFILFLSCFHTSVCFPVCPPACCCPPTLHNPVFLSAFSCSELTYPTVWLSPWQIHSFWVVYTSTEYVNAMIQLTEVASCLKLELIMILYCYNFRLLVVEDWLVKMSAYMKDYSIGIIVCRSFGFSFSFSLAF